MVGTDRLVDDDKSSTIAEAVPEIKLEELSEYRRRLLEVCAPYLSTDEIHNLSLGDYENDGSVVSGDTIAFYLARRLLREKLPKTLEEDADPADVLLKEKGVLAPGCLAS